MRALPLLALLIACSSRSPRLDTLDHASTPSLPAPVAGTYARAPAQPTDGVIRSFLRGSPWDASLSGAAAGLALDMLHDDAPVTPWSVREAAWRAGYPYPVRRIRVWSVAPGEAPPEELRDFLLTERKDGDDLGLVRARGAEWDVWVMMFATPRANIGVHPREAGLGTVIDLPALDGMEFLVASPEGRLVQGGLTLPQRFTLNLPGEWMFEVRDDQGLVARFPVHAGQVAPREELYAPGDQPETAEDRALNLLDRARARLGREPWSLDPLLAMGAKAAANQPDLSASSLAAGLGYAEQELSRLTCRAASVEDCLDAVLWDPRARPALAGPDGLLGLHVSAAPGDVQVTALVVAKPGAR